MHNCGAVCHGGAWWQGAELGGPGTEDGFVGFVWPCKPPRRLVEAQSDGLHMLVGHVGGGV